MLCALTKGTDPKTGFGTDIYSVNLDGTDLRPVVPHESENVFYDTPRYDPTGTFLYFHRNAAIVKNSGIRRVARAWFLKRNCMRAKA